MKKVLSALLTLAMLATVVAVPVAASADVPIKLGDYVQMGTYYGEPILWRVVSFEKISGYDDSGNPIIDSTDTVIEYQDGYLPLLLSDKIICLKAFDAGGDDTSGSHGIGSGRTSYGSDCWTDSNMRSWLNSDASAGNVTWLCGNPPTENHVRGGYNDYADEAGFLTNFAQAELNAIQPVTQKAIMGYAEYKNHIYDSGTQAHNYDGAEINTAVQNYAAAYSEQVTDTMFLLDVQQIYTVYANEDLLGDDYYIGEPTEQCVTNSAYSTSYKVAPDIGNKWDTWLRCPAANIIVYFNLYGIDTRVVYSEGRVGSSNPYDGDYGVRPACFLNSAFVDFISGCGTSDNPYIIDGGSDSVSAPAASSVTVTLNGSAIAFDQPPVIINDRTMVPLRAIFEALGASVDWDDETQTVTSMLGDTEVKLTINRNVLTKNGTDIYLDVPAQLYNDYTMVPVRAVAESFGAEVEWDEAARTVYILK